MKISHKPSFSMDRVALGEINSLLRQLKRPVPFEHSANWEAVLSTEDTCKCAPLNKLNIMLCETWKGQVTCHSKSSVLFSSLENNDWSLSYITHYCELLQWGFTSVQIISLLLLYLCKALIWPELESPKQERNWQEFFKDLDSGCTNFQTHELFLHSYIDVQKLLILLSYILHCC